jgi:hypothetical protein
VEEKPARQSNRRRRSRLRKRAAQAARSEYARGVCASPGIAVGKLVRWDDATSIRPKASGHIGGGKPFARQGHCDHCRRRTEFETVRDASQRGAVARRGFSRCIACCSKTRRCSMPRAI